MAPEVAAAKYPSVVSFTPSLYAWISRRAGASLSDDFVGAVVGVI